MRREPIDNRTGCLAIESMRLSAETGSIAGLSRMIRRFARAMLSSPDADVREEFRALKLKAAALRRLAKAEGEAAAVNWDHPVIKEWLPRAFSV